MSIALFFLLPAIIACSITPIIRNGARRLRIVDVPERAPDRKMHDEPKPLLGGLAVFFSFFILVLLLYLWGVDFSASHIQAKHLLGIFLGSAFLMVGGFLDDRYRLSPAKQIIWPILAALVVIASGIGVSYITNPFGGPLGTEQFRLDAYQKILFWFHGWPYKITFLADAFTFFWLLGMMYTTKFLDGLDGLVSGVTIIGALIIAALSLDPVVHQRETALLAVLFAGAFAGFLFWNWHPAKIFLGEGGSLFAGFMLGVLSIVSGSKVATTALVLGIPILDVLWVIARRLFWERHSPLLADRKHLHFRLLDIGLSHRKAVMVLYGLTLYFGIAALFLQSRGKLIAFAILSVSMLALGSGLVLIRWYKVRH
ncbi:undecaprenyl/decaprenyl-phosphate alpha-N-acetylglucosaminyl 1-phosphate transferase [Candidatus Uhrbacteria bacterium]|nr:undecaprenyl/decaprenyl-phosphate alpha-N-acetylglucosaminyl 1-phosphate transferase [Candidatus Uhrbacteria bacterium]